MPRAIGALRVFVSLLAAGAAFAEEPSAVSGSEGAPRPLQDRIVLRLEPALELSDAQVRQLRTLLSGYRKDAPPDLLEGRFASDLEALLDDDQRERFAALQEELRVEALEVLTERHLARLEGFVTLSPEQRSELAAPVQGFYEELAALRRARRGRETGSRDLRAMQRARRDLDRKITALLSPSQEEGFEAFRESERSKLRERMRSRSLRSNR